ncbi:RagB/SusD family nutrient uptake outer membrane protein [Pedobacter sp. ISL-68]|uniref:RagB/SusD family nutrient uptake outer membrane protein n=1 Tax=unclassified Pedobacter TaxID=2628915 RepID=UPI001BEAE7F9|nr:MULTISPECIES: RagB/SusD family nutrient uptake outer membrane protein [unclassified Pedobacter]MBT2562984.1 RagB/SusD family nutrient uptake outer membrane protein [Pedobacter sp. ISL-64]MBT2592988.1 RagB/SusD family nutrient uptake outer membrane protein [Pedobacter sp. ISL-68]
MMKIYQYLSFLLLLVSVAGCKKSFLEVVPKGQLVATTTDDYEKIMNAPDLYFYSFAGGWQSMVLMGDDVAAEGSYFSSASPMSQNAFNYKADIFRAQDNTFDFKAYTSNLYTVNKVINEIDESTGGSAVQKLALKAEALANRAWIYFQLINIYAKPYNPVTAAQDPGFPIIQKADINLSGHTRNSVAEVYAFIIQDFNDAISTLPQNNKFAQRFSKPAAEGMLAKVYLYMGRNAEALAMFNTALTDAAAQAGPAKLYDYNVEFASGGKFDPIGYNGPNNSPGINYDDVTESVLAKTFYNGPYSGNEFGNDFLVLSPKAQALFAPGDLRLNFYGAFFPYSTPNPSGRLSKYSVNYSKFGLQLAELYLLRAEANARLNNLAAAVSDLELLRRNRMPVNVASVPAQAASSKESLIRFIFQERTREFAMEGYRWFDMRRCSIDPIFSGETFSHIIYNDETSTNITSFNLPKERLTLRLPPIVMNANPGFTNNP